MKRVRLLLAVTAGLLCLGLLGAGTALASGGIVFDGSVGTGPPPATLGGHAMTPFPADPQPLLTDVASVADPSGDEISFESPMEHLAIGDGWATWSNGYAGDVYYTDGAATTTVDLPSGTTAFYLYAEPNPYAVFDITATAQDGSSASGTVPVDGFYGAQFFGFYATGTDTIASVTVSSSIDFSIGEFGINGGGGYVALGDSYSSGEGNPPFLAGTDGGNDFCHRSSAAYSEVLGAQLGLTPLFYACSGAITSNVTSTSHYTEPPQISNPGVDSTASLVTMTIGGNDAGFADVLKACIEQKLKADAINAGIGGLTGPIGGWLGLTQDPSCAHSSSFTSSVDQQIQNVFWPVKETDLTVLGKVDPQKTSVIVADYPLLFPSSSSDQSCLQLSFLLTGDDMNWMNGEGNVLDNVLQEAAAEAGVNFVDVRAWFAGHEVCTGDPYLNGLSIASGSGRPCTWSVLGHCIIPGGLPIVGSFHPNGEGHALGYAAAISSLIGSAADQTPAGFPANPPATPDPPGQPQPTAVGVGELDAHAVTAGTADCDDTYQAGQQVQYSGSGFAPGASVRVYATSAGGETLIDTTTADANGTVSGVARLPLSATGFTPDASALAGTVFVDAIGTGSTASHLDDLAMVGLVPHTGACGTVETLPFGGFDPPLANAPQVMSANAGRTIPVKFEIPGSNGTLGQVLAPGYPQSAPVSCTAPASLTTGDPTVQNGSASSTPGDSYTYVWKTDKSWSGCRELIVGLVDGSYHTAVINFH
jgi:hypothetical protein